MVDRRVKVTAELDAKGMIEGARQAESAVAKTGQAMRKTADQTEQASKTQESAFRRMARSAEENSQAWTTAGAAITAFGAVTTAALVGSAKAAVDWESAFAGVKKTVDDSEAGYAALSSELREMARTLPAAHAEIAGVAEAAGQLGISRENLTAFTRTMIDLGETTNLSADEAATSLARFANIMGTSQSEFSNLGSAIVGLGNNFATTEREIVDMSLRLAGAGRQAGMTEGEVLGLATALSSVGIQADAGGTAFSKVITEMGIAVDTSNDKLRTFAEVSGMSAEQFRAAWAENAGGAVSAFVEGMGRIQASGESLEPTLDALSMTDIRVGDALRRSAASSDMFAASMAMGNEEYAKNTALTNEAAQRYETTAAKLDVFRNSVRDAAISLGEQFLPAIELMAGIGTDVAGWLGQMPDPLQKIAAFGGAAAGGVSLLAGGFLLMAPRAVETYKALQTLGIITPTVTTNLRRMATFMNGAWGLAIAGAVAAIGYFIIENRKKKEAIEEVRQTLDEETAALTDNTRAWAARTAEDAGALEWAEKLGLASGTVTEAMLGNADAIDKVREASRRANLDVVRHSDAWGEVDKNYSEAADAGRRLVDFIASQAGVVDGATEAQARLNAEMDASVRSTRSLEAETERLAAQAAAYEASQEGANAAIGKWIPAMDRAASLGEEAADAYAKWVEEVSGAAGAFVNAGEALGNVNEATKAWAEAQADATDTGDDSWQDFWDGQSVSIDEYLAELERMLQAQTDWEQNMVILATRASGEVVEAFQNMGPDAAVLLQDLLDEGQGAMDRMGDILAEGGAQGTDRFAEAMANADVFEAVGARWGQKTMEAVSAEFLAGKITLQEIVDNYDLNTEIMVDGDIVPFELALGVALGMGDDATATPDIDGDPKKFNNALDASLRLGNRSTSTPTIAGNAAPFGAALGAALGQANRSTGTVSLNADAFQAYSVLRGFLNSIPSSVSVALRAIPILGALPGFMAGGYTGDFGKQDPVGLVHGQEFVSTAQTTADPYNRAALEFMHSGRSIREWAPAVGGAGGGLVGGHAPAPATFHLYDADGALLGTMRGVADSAVSSASRGRVVAARGGIG